MPATGHLDMPRHAGLRNVRRRLFRDSRGNSLIEAAIVTPLLLLISFGIMEFAWLLFVNLTLESGVSQAARFGITGRAMDGLDRTQSIKTVMREATYPLTIDDGAFQFSHLVGGSWAGGIGGPGDIAKVTVTYTHQALVLTPFFTNGEVELRVESAMKSEDRFE
jgi:hypothetical protein